MAELPLEIDVVEAAALREKGRSPAVRWIDCREPDEWHICHIDGAELLPLSTFAEDAPKKLADTGQHLLIYCHHGVRSMRAVQWLRAKGYHQTQSLQGGIDRWTDLIDPEMARY
jgi:rhodanese-related sulfurtransferase